MKNMVKNEIVLHDPYSDARCPLPFPLVKKIWVFSEKDFLDWPRPPPPFGRKVKKYHFFMPSLSPSELTRRKFRRSANKSPCWSILSKLCITLFNHSHRKWAKKLLSLKFCKQLATGNTKLSEWEELDIWQDNVKIFLHMDGSQQSDW